MKNYLAHQLSILGGSLQLSSEDQVTAVHEGSGGLLRRANAPARVTLLAAAAEKAPLRHR